jgi:2,3-bisphosphoglycerate-dependent phosphoglycerate mutase
MTTVYFIRHAESDRTVQDSRLRPLTEKGWASRKTVADFLRDKNITAVLSSPYKRAVDTVSSFAEDAGLGIVVVEDLREQKSSSDMRASHPDFKRFLRRQWEDFSYTYSDGETLGEVQERNVAVLRKILTEYKGQSVAVGTHATALSLIINHYDPAYGYQDFLEMERKLPWAGVMIFDGLTCVGIEKIELCAT